MQKRQKIVDFEIMFDRNNDTNYNYFKAMMPVIGKEAVI